MSSRRNRQDLSTAELRLAAQQLLAHQEDGPSLEELREVARLLGAKLVTVDADPRRPRDTATPIEEKKPKTAAEWEAISELELFHAHARTLGLKLVVGDPRR